mgnify:CR=1 FL=1
MKEISSVNNDFIKNICKLKQKKYRDEERKFIVEGYHLVEEAKEYLKLVLITDIKDKVEGVENILVTKDVINKISQTQTPQNIVGICSYFDNSNIEYNGRILLLDDLQDPGNIGTLIRSSLGFGIDLIVLSKNSVDIYNDKLIRSTQGAIFKVKIIEEDLFKVINEIKNNNIKVFGTSLKDGTNLNSFEKINKYALVLGNEGNGVRQEVLDVCDKNIFIEMDRKLESLNVGVSGSIIMHYFYK